MQRQPGGDALHIAAALERVAQRLPGAAAQSGNGAKPGARLLPVAPGREQPVAQQAAAHAGDAAVQQRQQRGLVFAAQGLRQLQVAPGAVRQVDQLVMALHFEAVHMAQSPALGVLGIGQQRGGGGVGLRQAVRLPGGKTGGLQLLLQFALAQSGVKLKIRPHRE